MVKRLRGLRIKRNMVAIKGRYFSDFARLPRTESIRLRIPSSRSSRTDCTFPGMSESFFRSRMLAEARKMNTKRDIRSAFVTGKFPI